MSGTSPSTRGFPTVEVVLTTDTCETTAIVPSGASTGEYEALELRDGGKDFHGKGVLKAVANVNDIIAPALKGKDECNQRELDDLMVKELDGTQNDYGYSKGKLGANAILPVSMAICRAGAIKKKLALAVYIRSLLGSDEVNGSKDYILPVPCFNVINGGSHAGNELAFQEFMICPVGASSFKEAMQMGTETYHHLKKKIAEKYGKGATSIGDEGGFAPDVDTESALDLLVSAISAAGYEGKIKIAMDVAASEFHKDGKYNLNKWKTGADTQLDTKAMIASYEELIKKYPIVSIEDPLYEGDFAGHATLTAHMGSKVQIVGDDLLVTNPVRIGMGIEQKSVNSLLLKVNQIGSVSESLDACKKAFAAGWGCMVSHRSGETEDTFIADLCVALNTKQIKTGAPCRSERLAKYNQLLRLEEHFGSKAKYSGPCTKLG